MKHIEDAIVVRGHKCPFLVKFGRGAARYEFRNGAALIERSTTGKWSASAQTLYFGFVKSRSGLPTPEAAITDLEATIERKNSEKQEEIQSKTDRQLKLFERKP